LLVVYASYLQREVVVAAEEAFRLYKKKFPIKNNLRKKSASKWPRLQLQLSDCLEKKIR